VNTKTYIDSGVIELYVLGALPTEEAAEVEQMAAVEPEVQAAVQAASQLLSRFATHFQEDPPAAVRRGIRRRLDELDSAASGAATAVDTSTQAAANIRYARVAMAASLGFIIVALLTAVNFYLRWQDAATAADRLAQQSVPHKGPAVFSEAEALLHAVQSTPLELVPLYPQAGAEAATVWLSYDPEKGELSLALGMLPAPGEGETYQLWALDEAAPVHLGGLSWSDSVQTLPVEGRFRAFAINRSSATGLNPPEATRPHWSGQR